MNYRGTPAAFMSAVYADDKDTARALAIEEHNIRPADQKRLIARPR